MTCSFSHLQINVWSIKWPCGTLRIVHFKLMAGRIDNILIPEAHYLFQVKTEGGLNASVSFIAKANPLNRPPNKRKSELQHALCNMLSSILAPLAEGGKDHWPPLGVEPALSLWYDAVARIRVQLMYWMDKQSKHVAVS